jgi:DNA-binding IclR family transcriptional regulator
VVAQSSSATRHWLGRGVRGGVRRQPSCRQKSQWAEPLRPAILDRVFLTISTTGALDRPATDLGFLLHKHPDRSQSFNLSNYGLAVALERHRMVARDLGGRFVLGPRWAELASAAGEDRLLAAAGPVLARLLESTGESVQVYRRQGDLRVCVAAAERRSGLRDTVPLGSALPMSAGSSAQVLLAWEEPERLHRGLHGAGFTASTLAGVRRRGWAQSTGEHDPGLASVSAPVRGAGNKVVAAVSVSGPVERLTRYAGRVHAPALLEAAQRLTQSLHGD